jgi:hypothetical protein
MGSKAAIVMFADRDHLSGFRGNLVADQERSEVFAGKILASKAVQVGALSLDAAVWPGKELLCAASFAGFEVACLRRFAQRHPSRLTEEISRLAAGRDAYGVFMHSVEDWAAFAVWSGGKLIRAVSASPEFGVIEDIGNRLQFEEPFWAGTHRTVRNPEYVLPFHPIDLGNEALREFFGFILEGRMDDSCIDPEELELFTFTQVSEAE